MAIQYSYGFNNTENGVSQELWHGSPFTLKYSFSGAKYVVILYKNPVLLHKGSPTHKKIIWPFWSFHKWIRFKKPVGEFSSITNFYEPVIRIYCFEHYFSLKPYKLSIKLNLHFMNIIDQKFKVIEPIIQTNISNRIGNISMHHKLFDLKFKYNQLFITKNKFHHKKPNISLVKTTPNLHKS
jgi:hypothetical protein